MISQHKLTIQTEHRSIYDITNRIKKIVQNNNIKDGICHIFCQHTSCSLILCENYDNNVKIDIEKYLSTLVIDGDKKFSHTIEGKDDMSAHIRTLLTQSEITIPIMNHALCLGKWQGINLYEHRYNNYQRNLIITLIN
jgi:secondary thiamine-phosphate synthase enzyme